LGRSLISYKGWAREFTILGWISKHRGEKKGVIKEALEGKIGGSKLPKGGGTPSL